MTARFITRNLVGVAAVLVATAASGAADFKIDGKTFTVPDGFTIELAAGSDVVPRPVGCTSPTPPAPATRSRNSSPKSPT